MRPTFGGPTFEGANLQGANFLGADVAGAFFSKKDFNPDWLKGAKNIDKIKLID